MNGGLHQKMFLEGVKELSQPVGVYSPSLVTPAMTKEEIATCSVELD
jgi:hypothetical protein